MPDPRPGASLWSALILVLGAALAPPGCGPNDPDGRPAERGADADADGDADRGGDADVDGDGDADADADADAERGDPRDLGGIRVSDAVGLPHDAGSCNACAARNCADERAACDADPSCVALRDGCGCGPCGMQCWMRCHDDHAGAQPLLDSLNECVAASCGTTFCASDQPVCEGESTVHVPECATCRSAHCCGLRQGPQLQACSDEHCAASCGVPICDSGLLAPSVACATCLSTACCPALTECGSDAVCLECVADPGCSPDALQCVVTDCAAEC